MLACDDVLQAKVEGISTKEVGESGGHTLCTNESPPG